MAAAVYPTEVTPHAANTCVRMYTRKRGALRGRCTAIKGRMEAYEHTTQITDKETLQLAESTYALRGAALRTIWTFGSAESLRHKHPGRTRYPILTRSHTLNLYHLPQHTTSRQIALF